MSPEGWELYSNAVNAWRNGDYVQAQDFLSKLSPSEKSYHKVVILTAYIYRSMGLYISLITLLFEHEKIFIERWFNLQGEIYSLIAEAYNVIGESRKAVEYFLLAAECEKNWHYDKCYAEYSNAIFASAGINNFSQNGVRDLFAGYRQLLSEKLKPFVRIKYNHNKLRIGYLSADFRNHPVGYLLYPLINGFSQDKFKVYCYSVGNTNDDVNTAFHACPVAWRDVAELDYIQLAEQIRTDEIDILVDCGGHTCNNRLAVFALRPAPVQISTIGWVGSTGLYDTDYLLTDKYCAPFKTNPFYTERFATIPGSHFCFSYLKGKYPEITESPVKRNDYITFGCFNNFAKVTDKMLKVWSEILRKTPDSKLILKHKLLGYEEGKQLAIERLMKAGISPERVELRGFSSDYLQQYNDIDIALDTFPYTGGMTTFDALYMGVPVISLVGERHGERFGYSLLSNVGLDMLTAEKGEEYVAKAAALAENVDVLSQLHENLRYMIESSPLMDDVKYVDSVEKIYEDIVVRD